MSYNCPHNKITKHINKFFNILFSVICGAKTNLNSGKYSNQYHKKDESQRHDFVNLRNLRKTQV